MRTHADGLAPEARHPETTAAKPSAWSVPQMGDVLASARSARADIYTINIVPAAAHLSATRHAEALEKGRELARELDVDGCRSEWSPDGASLYFRTAFLPAAPALVVPLAPGRAFPEFPSGSADALSAWRKHPGARVLERPTSIPGPDEATYIATKVQERRNPFRVPLQR